MTDSNSNCEIIDGHCKNCGRPALLQATDDYKCPESEAKQGVGPVTIYVACPACGETGLYQGLAEPEGTAVICLDCGGTAAKKLTYTPFTGRKPSEGVERVSESRGKFLFASAGPAERSMAYKKFLETIPAGPPSSNRPFVPPKLSNVMERHCLD